MTEPFVRADVQAYLDQRNARPVPPFAADQVAGLRAMAEQMIARHDLPVGDIAVDRSLSIPGPAGPIEGRFFDARERRGPGPLVLFFHGGGFVNLSPGTHAGLTAEIARTLDLPVLSAHYRLAPEHPWPAGVDDAEAAARWACGDGATRLDRRFTHLILCGDSAGGNFSAVVAMALRDRPAALPVLLQILLYPKMDMAGAHGSVAAFGDGYGLDRGNMRLYDAHYGAEPRHWRASPVLGDHRGLPPTLMVTAALDPLRDEGRAYAARSIEAGVPVTYREIAGQIHGFATFRSVIPSAVDDVRQVLTLAGAMIAEALAQPSAA